MTQVKNRVGRYIYQWHGRLLPIILRPAMTGIVQNIDALARELAELTNIYIKRGAVLAEVGNEGGSLGLEGGAYAALRAVRTDILLKANTFPNPVASPAMFSTSVRSVAISWPLRKKPHETITLPMTLCVWLFMEKCCSIP